MGASAGLVGSINPSLPISTTSNSNPFATSTTGGLNSLGGGISVLSGLNLGSSGILMLALVAIVGLYIFFRG